MFGWRYALEHCAYALRRENEERLYRQYMAECLRLISQNTAFAEERSYMTVSLHELLEPSKKEPEQLPGTATNRIREKLRS